MSGNSAALSGVAGRYASALFDLAEENGATDAVLKDAAALKDALASSSDLAASLHDPSISRDAMGKAIAALAQAMSLNELTSNTIGLMAANRRLSVMGGMLGAFEALAAEKRGEATVEVSSAAPLSAEQKSALSDTIAKAIGKTVHIHESVDPALIGGLIVRIGSKMIDASVASKLTRLQHAMKG